MKFCAYIAALHAALFCLALAVSPAGSGSMPLTGVGPPPVAAGGGFSIVFEDSLAANTLVRGTTYTYGTRTYGSGCTRVVVANIWSSSGAAAITGLTIGGVALAQVSGAAANTGGNGVDIWESTGALAGSSGTVQVTYNAALTFTSSVALYCLTTTTPTASAANGTTSGTGTVASSIVVPSGGGALVVTGNINGDAPNSGPTNSALDVDTLPGGFHSWFGHTTSTGTVSVSVGHASSGNYLSLASWGP